MVYKWEPWTQYGNDSVVEYECHRYKIIQPHTSEPNWQPPATPALWARLPEEAHGQSNDQQNYGGQHQQQHPHQQQQSFVDQSGGGGGYQDQPQSGYQEQQGQNHEGKEGGDWEDEKKKHRMEIGGGILGALAIGGGVFAYSQHKNKAKEDAKKQAWMNEASQEKWLQGANAHSDHYRRGGQSPPVYWLLIDKHDPIPNNAIEGGRENGHPRYIGRVYYKSGLHIGKVATQLGGCVIGWGGKEHNDFDKYEVLVGDKHSVKWVNHAEHAGNIQVQGWQPVEGGKEADGRYLFVCQAQHEGGVHPCKAADGSDYCIFSYGGKEHTKKEFNILAYA